MSNSPQASPNVRTICMRLICPQNIAARKIHEAERNCLLKSVTRPNRQRYQTSQICRNQRFSVHSLLNVEARRKHPKPTDVTSGFCSPPTPGAAISASFGLRFADRNQSEAAACISQLVTNTAPSSASRRPSGLPERCEDLSPTAESRHSHLLERTQTSRCCIEVRIQYAYSNPCGERAGRESLRLQVRRGWISWSPGSGQSGDGRSEG